MEEGREQPALRVEHAMRKPTGPILAADSTVADAFARAADEPTNRCWSATAPGAGPRCAKRSSAEAVKNGKGALPLSRPAAPARGCRGLHPDQSLDLALRLPARRALFAAWCIAPMRGAYWESSPWTTFWRPIAVPLKPALISR